MDIEIRDNSIRIKLDSKNAAYVAFHTEPGKMYLDSTYTPAQYRGKGIGSELMKAAVKYAYEKRLNIIPVCSFAQEYFKKHTEYDQIVQRS